jgi:hypothetical protein
MVSGRFSLIYYRVDDRGAGPGVREKTNGSYYKGYSTENGEEPSLLVFIRVHSWLNSPLLCVVLGKKENARIVRSGRFVVQIV